MSMTLEFSDTMKSIIEFGAWKEAQRLNNVNIGSEHLFLAALDLKDEDFCKILRERNLDLVELRREIESLIPKSHKKADLASMKFTPQAHQIIYNSMEEAKNHKASRVGTAHLLLGFLRRGSSIPGKILMEHHLNLKGVGVMIREMIDKEEVPLNFQIMQFSALISKYIPTTYEGLELIVLIPEHAVELFPLIVKNRNYLNQWLNWVEQTNEVKEMEKTIQRVLQRFHMREEIWTGIRYNDQMAGILGLNSIDWINRKAYIGYWLGESFQGKGIMTTSCSAMLGYCFYELKLNRIEIRCATGNFKSQAIPKRLGFQMEGTLKQAEWLHDQFVDWYVYGMVREDWEKLKTSQPK